MNRSHASRALVRTVAVVLAMVVVGLTPLTMTAGASAANGDVGAEGPTYGAPAVTGVFIDPDHSPTASKPQSKLWWAQNQWWGVLLNDSANAFHIYSFDAAGKTWTDTGVLVDSRETSHVDVRWDGTHLFTVGAIQKTNTTSADAIRFSRFSYVNGKYVADISGKTLNNGGVEAAVIAKDGHGRLWVAYTAANNVRYLTSDDNGTTFSGPTALPFPEGAGLDPDDIATVIGANDSASISWSRQGPQPTFIDGLYVATYKYTSATAGTWTLDKLLEGAYTADDHLSMSIDGDGAGRVFLVAKEGTNDNPNVLGTDTLIRLWVRGLDGQWKSYVVNQVADTVTRPVVVVDRDANLLRVFETGPEAGGAIYQKTTSLSNPSNFAAGRGTPVLKLTSDTFINNVTTTKQNVTKDTGLLLLASDQKTGRYVFNSDAVPTPVVTAPTASFSVSSATGKDPMTVTFTSTSTNASTYKWSFGDGATSTLQNPTHTYTTAGSYTVSLQVQNTAGVNAKTVAGAVKVYPTSGPTVRMTSPTGMFTTSRTVSGAWGPTSAWPTVTSYALTRSSAAYAGAVSAATAWMTTPRTSGSFTGTVGGTYCMQARGTDETGTAGPLSAARCTAVPLDERNLTRSKKWTAVSSRSYYLGTGMRTRSRGASMSKTVTGRHVSLIVAKTRGGGKVNVYVGGRLVKRVSLAATRTLTKQFVPIASFTSARTTSYRIVVVTSRKPVTIDGLAVSRN